MSSSLRDQSRNLDTLQAAVVDAERRNFRRTILVVAFLIGSAMISGGAFWTFNAKIQKASTEQLSHKDAQIAVLSKSVIPIARFIERYQTVPCFSITSFNATDASATIEVAGDSRTPFDALDKDFKSAVQFEANITGVTVTPAQCAALTFFNSMKANLQLAPRLERPARVNGRFLTGSILDVRDCKIEVLVVQDDGMVQNVTHFVEPGQAPLSFNIPVDQFKAGKQPRLLMVVASGHPISSLKPGRPLPADRLFPAVVAEATAKQEALGVAMQYFQVE